MAAFERTRSQGRPVVAVKNNPAQTRRLFSRLKKEGEVCARPKRAAVDTRSAASSRRLAWRATSCHSG